MSIRVVPLQPHCFAFGGFELQMIGAMEAARQTGLDIGPLDNWSRADDFDIIHFWGFEVAHFTVAQWAYSARKKLIMSALLAHPSVWRYVHKLSMQLAGASRIKFQMLPWMSALTVVNSQQADYAVKILGIGRNRVHVIPNIVEDIFFDPPANAENFNVGFSDYVLCTGNICRRKNQLMLVKACRKLGVPLLLVGDVLSGESAYAFAVADAMQGASNMAWIRGLAPGSEALAAAYRNCILFALPSYAEAQPISALEAAAAGKPILLADRDYARQEYFTNAAITSVESEKYLVKGLKRALNNPDVYSTPRELLESCRRLNVGDAYRQVYEAVWGEIIE
jgi:glycosyltransferase involved in cell wall biosynthesis